MSISKSVQSPGFYQNFTECVIDRINYRICKGVWVVWPKDKEPKWPSTFLGKIYDASFYRSLGCRSSIMAFNPMAYTPWEA